VTAKARPGRLDLSYIHESLRQFAVPLTGLTLDPRNARQHDDRNLQAITESLRAHGQVIPIVVQKQGRIVRAGNGRCLALKAMGRTHVAALIVDATDVEAVAFALRDNRTSELARWDFQVLAEHMKALAAEGVDLLTIGWQESEFAPLMEAAWDPPAAGDLERKPSQGTGDQRVASELAVVCDTPEQLAKVQEAILALRDREQDVTIRDGRALELICADYLAGA
jgi:ParB-like chromosome segregation protein Spo0J